MTPVYLSANQPRWTPTSEADLQDALDRGILDESHYLDHKELLATKSDNRETARDLASFAIDSGTLIIGVGEDKPKQRFFLAPQPLAGLAEKVEQVARSLTDPPLNVVTASIASEEDPTRGYLLVHVPASPSAPHMVDGRYYGRGEKTKHALSDPEVTRLHQRRQATEDVALALVQQEIAADPVPAGNQSRFFLIAQPMAGRRDLLLDLLDRDPGELVVFLIQKTIVAELENVPASTPPGFEDARTSYRISRGRAFASSALSHGRAFQDRGGPNRESAIEVQIHEDGGLRLYFSRLSFDTGDAGVSEQKILGEAAIEKTRRMIALVLAISAEAGYFGNWSLAVAATNLRNRRVYLPLSNFSSETRYDQNAYQQATAATWAELSGSPGAVTRRLIGPLLRALGVETHNMQSLRDTEAEQPPESDGDTSPIQVQ